MSNRWHDDEFQVAKVDSVEECEGGWVVGHNGWSLLCTNDECSVAPQVGEEFVMFGRGIGYTVRGIEIGGRVYRYTSKQQHEAEMAKQSAEHDKRRAVETAEMLVREAAAREAGEKYAWRDGMGEISGFGGSYEEACRNMVRAGLRWLDEHPHADPRFAAGTAENEDAKALDRAVTAACPDCSGAMWGASVGACLYVKKHGWDAYCAAMSRKKEKNNG